MSLSDLFPIDGDDGATADTRDTPALDALPPLPPLSFSIDNLLAAHAEARADAVDEDHYELAAEAADSPPRGTKRELEPPPPLPPATAAADDEFRPSDDDDDDDDEFVPAGCDPSFAAFAPHRSIIRAAARVAAAPKRPKRPKRPNPPQTLGAKRRVAVRRPRPMRRSRRCGPRRSRPCAFRRASTRRTRR